MPRKIVTNLTLAAIATLGLMTAASATAQAHDNEHFHSVKEIVSLALKEAEINLREAEMELAEVDLDMEELHEDLQELNEIQVFGKEILSDEEILRIIKQVDQEHARAMKRVRKDLQEISQALREMDE